MMDGQAFVGQMFITRLFEALQLGGSLHVHRPEGREDIELRKCTVTYDAATSQELVIHDGVKTTSIRVDRNWLSVQYLPGPSAGLPGSLLFHKTDNLALEILSEVRHV